MAMVPYLKSINKCYFGGRFMNEKLALKFRPQNLDDMVGQPHIKDILGSILLKHFNDGMALPAGMLFCGSRGIGKTTSARIIARVLNCQNRDGIKSCGVCSSCIQISKSNDTSVLEIDAASNGLVDDIRKLKEIAMTSHSGDYRVIVIDEVHGCSNAGFQALLKILEEPPVNTIFIMATTEGHKVPETIKSRLLVFEYKRLTIDDIVSRLGYIAQKEGIILENEASRAIANYVNGGMRDAVMILDQLHYVSDHITAQTFKDFFGIVDKSYYLQMIECLVNNDIAGGLIHLTEVFNKASSITRIVDDLIENLRDMLLVKNGVEGFSNSCKSVADKIAPKEVFDMINILWDFKGKIRASGANKISLEVVYARMGFVFKSMVESQTTSGQMSKESLMNFFK